MYIKEIELKDFRNYESLNLKFNKKVNFVIGDNAQGKTNLLEALSISSLGKSFRTQKDSEMIKFGCDFFRVKVIAEKEDDEEEICVEIALSQNEKAVKINEKRAKKTTELLKNIYIVIFSPDDLRIVKDEPEKRRRFIDRELCQLRTSYFVNLSGYKKALKQRNFLLKESQPDKELIAVWNYELAKYGAAVMFQRKEFIEKINKISKVIHKDITNGKEILDITYEPNIKINGSQEEQKIQFEKILADSFYNDIRNKTTGRGPHKDDIKLEIESTDIRHFGSQGQQRTAALSLKLAEIDLIKEETNEYPVLLLDDVMSELDKNRQHYMIKAFKNVQLFISTTELSEEIKKAFTEESTFFVENGNVKSLLHL